MGKLLGYHSDEGELDRPDLNKCPNCDCYFTQDNCPLCGMECPENMRAGNRAPVKQIKKKNSAYSNRVVFVNWYHSLWFIVLMMFLSPLISIILLATSPHSRKLKITLISISVVIGFVNYFGISSIANSIENYFEKPVDTSISQEEYVTRCELVDPEEFYRSPDAYDGKFVSMELKVISMIIDVEASYTNAKYPTYYICSASGGGDYHIMVRSCLASGQVNFIPGDIMTIYGEGAGICTVIDNAEHNTHTNPCVNMAYYKILK